MKSILSVLFVSVIFCSCGKSPDVIWRFKTGGPIYSSPAISGQNLIVASTDGYLYALKLTTGDEVWKQQIGTNSVGTPLVYNDLIYVGGGKGDLFCVDPSSGKIHWQFSTGATINYQPCADESGIYFGSRDSFFYKVSLEGARLWDFKTGYYIWGTCSFYKDFVVTSSWDYFVYALDRNTGNLGWKQSAGTQHYGSPEVLNDHVYYATHSILARLDAATGKLLHQAQTGYVHEVTIRDGFLWTNDNGLRKRTMDGTEVASVSFLTSAQFKPTFADGQFILAGNQILYGVSPDLKILWKYKAKDDFWRSGVAAGGAYYIGNRDSHVYALKIP